MITVSLLILIHYLNRCKREINFKEYRGYNFTKFIKLHNTMNVFMIDFIAVIIDME